MDYMKYIWCSDSVENLAFSLFESDEEKVTV